MKHGIDARNVVAEEAAEWFVTLQSANVERSEREAFSAWLQRSPVHVEEFLRVTALYGDLQRSAGIADADVEALRNEGQAYVPQIIPLHAHVDSARERLEPSRNTKWRAGWGIAASVMLMSVLWFAGPWKLFDGDERYATAIGEQRSLALADGSHIKLNVESTLSARVDEKVRDLYLKDGEALFDVAKDPSRPFRVHTPHAVVEATGTQFNVQVRNGKTTVSLIEGSVLVRETAEAGKSGAGPIALEPGEQLVVERRGGQHPAVRPVDPVSITAWTERRLVFEDATLDDVVAEFNRYSRQQLVVEDPELKKVRITAVFRSDDMETFIRALHAVSGLDVERSNGAWSIKEPVQQSAEKK